jgi:hypothetical protein
MAILTLQRRETDMAFCLIVQVNATKLLRIRLRSNTAEIKKVIAFWGGSVDAYCYYYILVPRKR